MQQTSEKRYVAHIDILGMSSMVERNFDSAWETLSSLTEVRDHVSRYGLEFTELGEEKAVSEFVQMITFSDTIVVFTKDGSKQCYLVLLVVLMELFHKALCSCIPIRAGVAFGVFCFNFEKSLFAGPALIEAYRIGESAQWLGISLAPSLNHEEHSIKFGKHGSTMFTEWAVPLKDGSENLKVLNWPFAFEHDLKIEPPIQVHHFYEAFEPLFGAFEELTDSAKKKYENTVVFMNEMLAKS